MSKSNLSTLRPKTAKNPTRAEIESLIERLLVWQNEQLEFKTGLYPDEDRPLNPVDKLRLAHIAQDIMDIPKESSLDKSVSNSFKAVLSTGTVPAVLFASSRLIDGLLNIRETMPDIESPNESQAIPAILNNADFMKQLRQLGKRKSKYTPDVVDFIIKLKAQGKTYGQIARQLTKTSGKPFTDRGVRKYCCEHKLNCVTKLT